MLFIDANAVNRFIVLLAGFVVVSHMSSLPVEDDSMKSATFTSLESVFTNKRINTDLIAEFTNIMKIACMGECLSDLNCDSVGYHSGQKKCRLHDVIVSGSGGVTESGWEYYSMQEDFCSQENFVHNRILDICYYIPPGSHTCPDAIAICSNFSANLLTVDSQAKQDWTHDLCVSENIDGTFFDAFLDSHLSVWKLGKTGMELTYTYWDGGEPDNFGHCIGTKPYHGWEWHDYPVEWTAGIICEIRRP
ncbi:uncharacterized protein LOC117317917 [Pecten maximus]|uniref:uncharacterized protein LOC117317917 n=1 Tax=Pecten maximus TaxID=6579 RepID=UPI001458E491|nr:uncharacterized protein LOC117317917 [Pecten maximus]